MEVRYEEFEVYATWIKNGEPDEEFVGTVDLRKDWMPDELEIDGVVYYPKK